MKILAAMSGGVDSSVAAALLLGQGHDVVGVTLKQWEGPNGEMPTAGCCTVGDAEDARRVAAQLDIPYYVLDYVEQFRWAVVEPFGAAYAAGRTPNPCVECNRSVRFAALLDRAAQLDCDALATGHHARVRRNGSYRLLRGKDRAKDQSYVLHMLGQAELARVRFPVGEMSKTEVRDVAARLGLRTAAKPDSQDICFVGRGDYRDFLRRHFPDSSRPGDVVDTSGRVVGRHEGTSRFTVGQRRGLRLSTGERRYVVRLDPANARVVIGGALDLEAAGCLVSGVKFVAGTPPARQRVSAQIRYRSNAASADLIPGQAGSWTVRFHSPASAVAPGQAAVFYDEDEVLGGGTIDAVLPA